MKCLRIILFVLGLASGKAWAGGSAGEWLGPDVVKVASDANCSGPELNLRFIEQVGEHEWRVQLDFNRRSYVEVANLYYDGINDHIQIYSTSGVQWPYQSYWGIYGNSKVRYSMHAQGDVIIEGTIECFGLERTY